MSVSPLQRRAPTVAFRGLSRDDVVSLIGAVPFFEVLPPDQRAKLGERAIPRTFEAGETIAGQGDYGHTMFIVGQGRVRIEAINETGHSVVLATLSRPGVYFGEVALLGRSRRTASIIAETKVTLIELEKTVVEQANKKAKGKVFDKLRAANSAREVAGFLEKHRYFTELDEQTILFIAGQSKVKGVERGKTIFEPTDPDNSIMLVKSSMAKLVRVREGSSQESILSYYNVGDLIGIKPHASRTRENKLISMGYCEVIEIDRAVLEQALAKDYPALFKELSADMESRDVGQRAHLQKGKTVAIFVGSLLEEGAQEGQSLLNINLNKCVRCGNCVKACHDRHGYARFSRRGKKLVRRKKMEQEGNHETILLPASCRHCVNPECMIGCPTGAIHRKSGGEVDIHDFCIGCASCANRCPWGNITMVTTPKPRIVPSVGPDGKQVDTERPQIAAKCNLCHGFEFSNCVNNCPTGAILRVDPTQYFEEIAEVFREQQGQSIGQSTVGKRKRIELTHPILGLMMILFVMGMVALKGYELSQNDWQHTAYSWPMITLGGLAFLSFFGAITLAVRRRIKGIKIPIPGRKSADENRFKSPQGGAFLTWTRAHLYLGATALIATLLHAGGNFGGAITSMIMIMTYLVIVTGIFGVIYYKWLPRRITNIEGESQVEEDLLLESKELDKRSVELLEDASPALKSLASKIKGVGGGTLTRFSLSYSLAGAQEKAQAKFTAALAGLASDENREAARMLINDAVRRKDIKACFTLYRIRRGWLTLHIGIAASLITLVLLHVAIVLAFRAG